MARDTDDQQSESSLRGGCGGGAGGDGRSGRFPPAPLSPPIGLQLTGELHG